MPIKKTLYLILLLLIFVTAVHLFLNKKTAAVNFYAGSKECGRCHNQIYSEWQKTAHANSLLSAANETMISGAEYEELNLKLSSVNYSIESVKYAIGYHWTRRYILSDGKISPFLYSLQTKKFMNYYDKNYKHTNFATECAGCHVTGLNVINSNGTSEVKFNEAAVGCEACHGPGSLHSKYATKDYIINPAALSTNEALMICASCHTNGNDINGRFKFALNYTPGKDLMRYYKNMVPKPGQMACEKKEFEYKGDNTINDRLKQLKYWQYIFMKKSGSSCSDCLDFRDSSQTNNLRKKSNPEKISENFSPDEYCMSCHKFIGEFDVSNLKTSNEISVNHQNVKYAIKPVNLNSTDDISITGAEQCIKCHNFNSVHNHMVEISETSELIIFSK